MILYERHRLLRKVLYSVTTSPITDAAAKIETTPSTSGSGSTTLSSQTPTPYHIHVEVVDDDNNDDDKTDVVVVETDYYQDILGSKPADENEASSRNFVNITCDGVWWMEALHPVPAVTESTLSFSHKL